MNQLDQFKKHISEEDWDIIEGFIEDPNNADLSLNDFNRLVDFQSKRLETFKSALATLIEFENSPIYEKVIGAQINLLNYLDRKTDRQTMAQQNLLLQYRIDQILDHNPNFRNGYQELLVDEEFKLESLKNMRMVFLNLFPEAQLSPRSPRSILKSSSSSLQDQQSANLASPQPPLSSPPLSPPSSPPLSPSFRISNPRLFRSRSKSKKTKSKSKNHDFVLRKGISHNRKLIKLFY